MSLLVSSWLVTVNTNHFYSERQTTTLCNFLRLFYMFLNVREVVSHRVAGSLQYCEPGLREDWKGAVGSIKVRHYWGLIDFECKAQCIEERICKNCL